MFPSIFALIFLVLHPIEAHNIESTISPNGIVNNRGHTGGLGNAARYEPSRDAENQNKRDCHECGPRNPSSFLPDPNYKHTPNRREIDYENAKQSLRSEAASFQKNITDSKREIVKTMDRPDVRLNILDVADFTAKKAYDVTLENDQKVYKNEAARDTLNYALALADFATSMLPGISWGRDIYEAVSGKDLFSAKDLTFFERGCSVAGILSGSLVKNPMKALKFFDVMDNFGDKRIIDIGMTIGQAPRRPIAEIRSVVSFLRRHGMRDKGDNRKILRAYEYEYSKIVVLEKDTVAYRYYTAGKSDPRGNWLTPKKIDNPQSSLALKYEGPYEVTEWVIPKGTEVLEGYVAMNFGQMGGGRQIFVPNKEVLVLK